MGLDGLEGFGWSRFLNHLNASKLSKLLLFLKHFKHAVRDDKAADDVEGAEQNSQKAQRERQVIVAMSMAHHDDGADDHHAVNGIGARHERGVQDSRHVGNHLDAQQNGQDDDVDNGLILKEKV